MNGICVLLYKEKDQAGKKEVFFKRPLYCLTNTSGLWIDQIDWI